MGTTRGKDSKKSNSRGTGLKQTAPSGTTKKRAEFKPSLLSIASEVNSVGDEYSWELRNKSSCSGSVKTTEPNALADPILNKNGKEATDKPEKKRATKGGTNKETAKVASKCPTPSSPVWSDNKENGLNSLWEAAKTSKAKKPKESQVWIDSEFYRKIEMLNLKNGKQVPTKHLVNAILQIYLNEHKTEISKVSK